MKDVFRIDLRSLAVLRMGLGLIIVWDVLVRVPWLDPFYSDKSFFTRELSQISNHPSAWSLYWLDGSISYAAILFGATIIAAVSLLVGFRTRLATLVCLILVYSMSVRMPLSLDAGHVLLRMLLFWSLFLPIGAKWSIDARLSSRPLLGDSVTSISSAAIMIQFASMYFFSGLAKCNSEWWFGDAIRQSLSLEMYAWPLATVIRDLPSWLLLSMGRLIVITEVLGPLLLFVPRVYLIARPVFAIWFWLMHIGIWLTLSIGVFAAVAMLGWSLLIPLKSEKGPAFKPVRDVRSRRESSQYYAGQIFCGVVLVYVVLLNISNTDNRLAKFAMPDAFRSLGWVTMTAQEFKMFGQPPQHNPELQLSIWTREDRPYQQLTLHGEGSDPEFEQKPLPYQPDHNTRRMEYNLVHYFALDPATVTRIRDRWGAYLFRRWSDQSSKETEGFKGELRCRLMPLTIDADESEEIWWSGRSAGAHAND